MSAPGTFLALTADIEQARNQTHQFYTERHPEMIEKRDRWLRDAVAPTGQAPATHYLCFYKNMTDNLWLEMLAYIAETKMPLVTERLAEGTTKDAFLQAKGLMVIE
jgi:hypothetical protein